MLLYYLIKYLIHPIEKSVYEINLEYQSRSDTGCGGQVIKTLNGKIFDKNDNISNNKHNYYNIENIIMKDSYVPTGVMKQYTLLWNNMLANNNSTMAGAEKLVEALSDLLLDEYVNHNGEECMEDEQPASNNMFGI